MDTVVASVIASFQKRSEVGQAKYGTTLDRSDLSTLQWIQNAQEEAMDLVLYLEKLKQLHQPKIKFDPNCLKAAPSSATTPERQAIADRIAEYMRDR
jgi:hypothetical protein